MRESPAEKIVRALDREIRGRGRGTVSSVERAVGRERSWWQHRVEAGDISLQQLLVVLDHLGLDPVRFLRNNGLGSEAGLGVDRPRGKPPEIVRKAWERLAAEPPTPGDIGPGYLEDLEREHYENPQAVADRCREIVNHVELPLLPRLLGIAGSALQVRIELDDAEHALFAGIEIAQQRGDYLAVADLLRRQSYVLADRGDRAEAVKVAEKAALKYAEAGCLEGVGKAFVAQGTCLYYLGETKEGIASLKAALNYLPQEARRYRFGALQVLGLCCVQDGELESALQYAQRAEELTPDMDAEAKLWWLKAFVHEQSSRFDAAVTCLEEVIERIRHLHYGELALATCDLARIQLLMRRPGEARLTIAGLLKLIEPVRRNPVISAAIVEIFRVGELDLDLSLVSRVREKILKAREHRKQWHSLAVA